MRPFVDHVPRLETEVEAMMTVWKDIACGQAVRVGPTCIPHLKAEMEAELDALVAQEMSQVEEAEAPQDAHCPASQAAEDIPRPEADDENLRRCKKRRLQPGAMQSTPFFRESFSTCEPPPGNRWKLHWSRSLSSTIPCFIRAVA